MSSIVRLQLHDGSSSKVVGGSDSDWSPVGGGRQHGQQLVTAERWWAALAATGHRSKVVGGNNSDRGPAN